MSRPVQHNFDEGPCPHPNCGGGESQSVSGDQCAECGHYFASNQVRFHPADNEPRCRQGMGHNRWIDQRRAARRARS